MNDRHDPLDAMLRRARDAEPPAELWARVRATVAARRAPRLAWRAAAAALVGFLLYGGVAWAWTARVAGGEGARLELVALPTEPDRQLVAAHPELMLLELLRQEAERR